MKTQHCLITRCNRTNESCALCEKICIQLARTRIYQIQGGIKIAVEKIIVCIIAECCTTQIHIADRGIQCTGKIRPEVIR